MSNNDNGGMRYHKDKKIKVEQVEISMNVFFDYDSHLLEMDGTLILVGNRGPKAFIPYEIFNKLRRDDVIEKYNDDGMIAWQLKR
jgi:hypothetical protein